MSSGSHEAMLLPLYYLTKRWVLLSLQKNCLLKGRNQEIMKKVQKHKVAGDIVDAENE